METVHKSIVLIGMPGSGKSTLGILLAKKLGLDFIDTDVSIQVQKGKTLQQIIDETDYLTLRSYEQQILLDTAPGPAVIATGGSAVYSQAGMSHLKTGSTVVFLDVALETLKLRITDYHNRGIAQRQDQSFDDLFAERRPLYQQYADITIDCHHTHIEETLSAVLEAV